MSNRTRGATFGAFLVGTAVCGVITGGVLYFFSDTFRTRANETYRQLSEWTPENIAEDPINYLNFAEEQTARSLVALKQEEGSLDGLLVRLRQEQRRLIRLRDTRETLADNDELLVKLDQIWSEAGTRLNRPLDKRLGRGVLEGRQVQVLVARLRSE